MALDLDSSNSSSFYHLRIFLVLIVTAGVIVGGFVAFTALKKSQQRLAQKTAALVAVELKTGYENPFDQNTQYVNPFDEYKNPLRNL